jgi:hypothetical protein
MRIVQWLVGAGALLAGAVVAVLIVLWPPAPLVVPQQDFALVGVTIVNPGRGRKPNQRIQIHAGRIKSITDDSPVLPDSPDVHRYTGAYVLPGLIDMHVHHPAAVQALPVRASIPQVWGHGGARRRKFRRLDSQPSLAGCPR